MRVFINGYVVNNINNIRGPVIADIDSIILNTETLWDGYVVEEKGFDIKQIKNIVKGLELMGCTVKKIVIPHANLVMETKYYNKFPEDVIDEIRRTLIGVWPKGREVYIKGNRLYTKVENYEIALPKDMWSDFDERTLRVEFHV